MEPLNNSRINAVLFDLDGVLIDAQDWHFEAFNEALSHFGFTPVTYDFHLSHLNGRPSRVKLEILMKILNIPDEFKAPLLAYKQQKTHEVIEKKCTPVPEITSAMHWLKQKQLRCAVCSNSIRITIEQVLDLMEIKDCFDLIVSPSDVVDPKPSPAVFLKALEVFHVLPREALILEDSPIGLKASEAAKTWIAEIKSSKELSKTLVENAFNYIHENSDAPPHIIPRGTLFIGSMSLP